MLIVCMCGGMWWVWLCVVCVGGGGWVSCVWLRVLCAGMCLICIANHAWDLV
jgi:hypothetical protein